MDQPSFVPEQVRRFAPKPKPPKPRRHEPTGGLMSVLQKAVAISDQKTARAGMPTAQLVPGQAPKFVPAPELPKDDPIENAGRALVTMLNQAAGVSNEKYERANILAGRLAGEVRTLENRIKELEAQVSHFRERAARAEEWLQRISREIESRLIAPQDTRGVGT
jgi:outer membrane murein-binding lipoprotein Lpp